MNGFTVCVLLYGDHLPLAQRCLGSIMDRLDTEYVSEIRIGLNEVCAETRQYVIDRTAHCGVPVWIYECDKNAWKYPLMRRMFYDDQRPVVTPFVMWFDDDSAITSPDRSWWSSAYAAIQQADMIGDIFRIRLVGDQEAAIKAQPWYNRKPLRQDSNGVKWLHFVTGGWWCIRPSLLRRWNYPWPELRHNGGDRMLGEMLRQQALKMTSFKQHIWINADDHGGMSKAKRRGTSQPPLWDKYDPAVVPDLSHQEFVCKVYRPEELMAPRHVDIPVEKVAVAPVAVRSTPQAVSYINLPGF